MAPWTNHGSRESQYISESIALPTSAFEIQSSSHASGTPPRVFIISGLILSGNDPAKTDRVFLWIVIRKSSKSSLNDLKLKSRGADLKIFRVGFARCAIWLSVLLTIQ